MVVDYKALYAEGRRLYNVWQAERAKLPMILNEGHDTTAGDVAHARFIDWVEDHAEALLNPDPWRPISELEEKHKDGREILLYAKPELNFTMLGTWEPKEEGSPWAWRSIEGTAHHVDCFTHFRELKGPGHV